MLKILAQLTMTVLEEYCVEDPSGRLTKYAGNRAVHLPEGCREGAQYGKTFKLPAPVTIYRGGVNRKPVVLKAGTRVWRWHTGLGLKPKSSENA